MLGLICFNNMSKNGIGVLNEKSLHVSFKEWVSEEGDEFEVGLEGSVIDIVRGEQLIEIQTRNLGAMKRKLTKLLPNYQIQLIHPIPVTSWLVKLDKNGERLNGRRRSPKKGSLFTMFGELVSLPHLLTHENLTLTVVLIDEEVEKKLGRSKRGRWRREKWQVQDRLLLNVLETHSFSGIGDYLALFPEELSEEFTTADLSKSLSQPRKVAQQI